MVTYRAGGYSFNPGEVFRLFFILVIRQEEGNFINLNWPLARKEGI
jgi:hypothetical protein